jgi:integrase
MPALKAAASVKFTPHDCRRTFRSGLSRLGVEADIAELMLNHTRADLIERYDFEKRLEERQKANELWANHIAESIGH